MIRTFELVNHITIAENESATEELIIIFSLLIFFVQHGQEILNTTYPDLEYILSLFRDPPITFPGIGDFLAMFREEYDLFQNILIITEDYLRDNVYTLGDLHHILERLETILGIYGDIFDDLSQLQEPLRRWGNIHMEDDYIDPVALHSEMEALGREYLELFRTIENFLISEDWIRTHVVPFWFE
jgi:hypothetical protein